MLQRSSNRHISTWTVQRLSESGLHGRIAAKKPLLKDNNKKKRLAWAKKHEKWILDWWKSVLWSDESKHEIFYSNRCVFVRRRVGERMISECVVPIVKHGGGVMVPLSAAKHHLFFNRTMTQHTSRLCKGYLTKKDSDGVLYQMTWPPQSPNLNPIRIVCD